MPFATPAETHGRAPWSGWFAGSGDKFLYVAVPR